MMVMACAEEVGETQTIQLKVHTTQENTAIDFDYAYYDGAYYSTNNQVLFTVDDNQYMTETYSYYYLRNYDVVIEEPGIHTLSWSITNTGNNTNLSPCFALESVTYNGDDCADLEDCTNTMFIGDQCLVCPVEDDSQCDDGNECTDGNGSCQFGVCQSNDLPDGTPCSMGGHCSSGTCTQYEDCDDDNPCTIDSWNGTKCSNDDAPVGFNCDDGLFCNGTDTCDGSGTCVAGTPPWLSDGIDCTDDICDEENNIILHTENDANCNDGLFCNGVETCDYLQDCQTGNVPWTDDGVSCTVDSCDESSATILHDPDHTSCNDSVECTIDECDPVIGCSNTPDDTICDDDDPCTVDICDLYLGCIHEPLDCDDDKECTIDSCELVDNVPTCVHSDRSNGEFCSSDDNECTQDICTDGVCTHPAEEDGLFCADDENPCTSDICSSGACSHPPVEDGTSCDENEQDCTFDTCQMGYCEKIPHPDCQACGDNGEGLCAGGYCDGPVLSLEEDFESGEFPQGWTTGGDAVWVIDNEGDNYSIRSGEIDAIQTTWLRLTVDMQKQGTLSFDYRPYTRYSNNYLIFSIDGEVQDTWYGDSDFYSRVYYTLNAGIRTIEWRYYRVSTNNVENKAWIDNITIDNVSSGCNDNNDCTTDLFDGVSCITCNEPDDTTCDDGNSCTGETLCQSGECISGTNLDDGTQCADDDNLCTSDTCSSGVCQHNALVDGTSCDSNEYDCVDYQCISGTCENSERDECDECGDEKLCVGGICGGYPSEVNESFEDNVLYGNWVTGGDKLWQIYTDYSRTGTRSVGVGQLSGYQNAWLEIEVDLKQTGGISFWYDNYGDSYSLLFYINGSRQIYDSYSYQWEEFSYTNLEPGHYTFRWVVSNLPDYTNDYYIFVDDVHITGLEEPCEDDGNMCTAEIFDSESCVTCNAVDGTECDDSDACSSFDTCLAGQCTVNEASIEGTPCQDDDLECTEDLCNDSGSCIHPALVEGTPCSDEGNECTDDICDGTGTCGHPAYVEGTPCGDSDNVCLIGTCNGSGECSEEAAPDDTSCFADSCDEGVYAGYCLTDLSEYGISGSARDWCTERGSRLLTYDEWVAITDAGWVRPTTDYRTVPVEDCPSGCSDGVCNMYAPGYSTPTNLYTCGDTYNYRRGILCVNDVGACEGGVCVPHVPCDDGNPCTIDTWRDGACRYELATLGTSCDDEEICTENDICDGNGTCMGSTIDCSDDLFCNGLEVCESGVGCVMGEAPILDDGVDCTEDTCNEDNDVILHTPMDEACNDGVSCNGVETCHLTLGCLNGVNQPNGSDCDEDPYDCKLSVCQNGQCNTTALPDCSTCGEDGEFTCAGGSCGGYGEEFAEGFEFCGPQNGCFHPAVNWDNDENLPWQIINLEEEGIEGLTRQAEGNYALKGQVFEYNQSTEISFSFFTNDPDSELSFRELRNNLTDYAAYIYCYLDDTQVFYSYYDSSYWYQQTVQVDGVGEHEFRCNLSFTYNNYANRAPIFYLDDIRITGNTCANVDSVDCIETLSGGTSCVNCPYPDGSACDDDNPCTAPIGSCVNGQCEVELAPNDTPCGEDLVCLDGECIETDCDDDNPCTIDAWLIDTCTHDPVHEGTSCSDGVYCNGIETCDNQGHCQPGGEPLIDDGLSCTDDACDEALDIPVHYPMDEPCNDGLYCNGIETCDEFLGCVEGDAPNMNDESWCTVDTCDEETDTILHTPDNERCSNYDVCDGEEICDAQLGCLEGTPLEIDDGVDCTNDWCDSELGVQHDPIDDYCNDDEPCNGIETCDATLDCQPGTALDEGASCDDDPNNCIEGTCVEGNCQTVNVEECSPCDGGGLTSGYCFDGICQLPLKFFHDGFENSMNAAWDSWVDNAEWSFDESAFVEGSSSLSASSQNDEQFFAEIWMHVEIDRPAKITWWQKLQTQEAEFGEGNDVIGGQALTFFSGNGEGFDISWSGISDWTMQEYYLEPGNFWLDWFYRGFTEEGVENHIWLDDINITFLNDTCSDGNGCTLDFDIDGECNYCNLAESTSCDDGNSCTNASICQAGECVATSQVTNGLTCWNGSECTGEGTCQDGICQAEDIDYGTPCSEDDNECTSDVCNGFGECVHENLPQGSSCSDDNNDCTGDVCNGSGECLHETLPFGFRCGGWNECAVGSYGEICLSHLSDPCLSYGDSAKQWCEVRGAELITHEEYLAIVAAGWTEPNYQYDTIANAGLDTSICPDGVGNFWVPGDSDPDSMWRCGDAISSCNRAALCVSRGGFCNGDICERHDECRDDDPCTKEGWNGECYIEPSENGTACEQDDNPCTLDECLDGVCNTILADGTACDADGSSCTLNDFCLSGVCITGQLRNCDDGDPCTLDSCDEIQGCVHEAFSCDDENECTDDICFDDRGVPACEYVMLDAGIPCNSDGNDCTRNICDGSGACTHPPTDLGSMCDDENACTESDLCDGLGQCIGTPIDCDDGLFCNGMETCNENYGCQNGDSPELSDGMNCTIDTCNEETNTIEHVADNSYCNDGDPCNGEEICHPDLGCRPGMYLNDGTSCDKDPNDCADQYCDNGHCIDAAKPDCTTCGENGTNFCAGGACGGIQSDISEGFESCAPNYGCFDSSYAWINNDENPWIIRRENDHGYSAYDGSYGLFARVDEENGSTSISLRFYTTNTYTSVYYRHMFYCGASYYYRGTFSVTIDGENIYNTNYNRSYWSNSSHSVEGRGLHEITWEIRNDYSYNENYPITLFLDSIQVYGTSCHELEECATSLFNGTSCIACPAVNGTECDTDNPCTNGTCQQGSCQTNDRDGQSCDLDASDCTMDTCVEDTCTPQNLPNCTTCLENGVCGNGVCFGTEILEDGFENGAFSDKWQNDKVRPWIVTEDLSYSGSFSATAIPEGAFEDRTLTYTIDLEHEAILTFKYKVDSVNRESYLEFWSSTGQWNWWYETTDWQQATFYLNEGYQELIWYFAYDDAGVLEGNQVWIDDIRIEYNNYCANEINCRTSVWGGEEECVECVSPDGWDCNASGGCTQNDTCLNGECQPGDPLDNGLACEDDFNPCTADSCLDGECVHNPVENNLPCTDDDNPCTVDACLDGVCSHTPLPQGTDCDDDPSDCTVRTCSEYGYCSAEQTKEDCESCGGDDERFCAGGTCSGLTTVCDETFESGSIRHSSYGWSGDASWTIAEDESHTGTKSYASPYVSDSRESEFRLYSIYLETPGTVSFYVKTDTEADQDELIFAIDGYGLMAWSGDTDWTRAEFPIEEGSHTLYWVYAKDEAETEGRDKVWVDDILVQTIPESPCDDDIPCTANLLGYEICVFCAFAQGHTCEDGNTCTQTGQCDGSGLCQTSPVTDETPCEDDGNLCTIDQCSAGVCEHPPVIDGTTCDEDTADCINDICLSGTCTPQSVDDCSPCRNGGYCAGGICGGFGSNVQEDFESGHIDPSWQSGGNVDWEASTQRVFEGNYSAASGVIGDNQTTWLGFNVTLNESGQASFQFKVESEPDCDFFVFYLDGELKGQWSGYLEWTLQQYDLEPGFHSLDWGYIKDYEDSDGRDRAWLDQIQVTGIGPICEDNNDCTIDLYNGSECVPCSLPDQTLCNDEAGVCEEGVCTE